MIGINDCWRRYDHNDPTPVEAFETNYRTILTQTKEMGAEIVLCEPFVLLVMEGQEKLARRPGPQDPSRPETGAGV